MDLNELIELVLEQSVLHQNNVVIKYDVKERILGAIYTKDETKVIWLAPNTLTLMERIDKELDEGNTYVDAFWDVMNRYYVI